MKRAHARRQRRNLVFSANSTAFLSPIVIQSETPFVSRRIYAIHFRYDGTAEESRALHCYFLATSIFFAASSSFFFASSTLGYARSSDSSVSTSTADTTSRVNHLLSAGTPYHGASSLAVFAIISSYAV